MEDLNDWAVTFLVVGVIACLCFGCGSCEARRVESRTQLVRELSDKGKSAEDIERLLKLTR